jgi:uncharacterized protein YxjI
VTGFGVDRFEGDRFTIEQVIRPMVNLYRISADGQPVAFVRQKRLKLKEEIRFFADESQTEELFRLDARQVLDVRGRFDVVAVDGTPIAMLEKVFGASLLRSTWRVLAPEGTEVAVAREQNQVVAILRRVQDTIPLPYHFEILSDGRKLGEVRRRFSIRDRYDIDLSNDVERKLDRRAAIALAVALDALQRR